MLLIDHVDQVISRKMALANGMTVNEEVFNGHFPTTVLPGALIVESLAQTGQWPCSTGI